MGGREHIPSTRNRGTSWFFQVCQVWAVAAALAESQPVVTKDLGRMQSSKPSGLGAEPRG